MANPMSPAQCKRLLESVGKRPKRDDGTYGEKYYQLPYSQNDYRTDQALVKLGLVERETRSHEYTLTERGVHCLAILRFAHGLWAWRLHREDYPQQEIRHCVGQLGFIPMWQAAVDLYEELTERERLMLVAAHGGGRNLTNAYIVNLGRERCGGSFPEHSRYEYDGYIQFCRAFDWVLWEREAEELEAAKEAAKLAKEEAAA